jgi:L-rhamnose mutarotase
MIRLAHTFTLHPGMEEEYERRHKPIWPELAAKLKEHGAHNYSIFRHGQTLIAYVEVEDQ